MLVRIDAASERPIYAQIADSIRGSIAAQHVFAGQLLPPAREIAAGLGINAHTVLHAYQELRDEGLVDLRRGAARWSRRPLPSWSPCMPTSRSWWPAPALWGSRRARLPR
ncbi:GntR family transcriptional regulator [Leucobacter sp. HNU]|uniref:GntR family transcriptional regulator n=1 Tax=Leucobacter sp. HNU TaxID=3236805 RepID=UPI003A7F8541